jgi:hypothetical protein
MFLFFDCDSYSYTLHVYMLAGGTRVKNPGICTLTPNRMPSLCNR